MTEINYALITQQLKTLGLDPDAFYALETQEAQTDAIYARYMEIGETRTELEQAAFKLLISHAVADYIPAPTPMEQSAEDFPQLAEAMDKLLEEHGLEKEDIEMVIALLDEKMETPWDFDDLHDMLFHLVHFRATEGRAPSMDELDEIYDEHEPEETHETDAAVEDSDPDDVYATSNQPETPESIAQDFANEFGGLWLAMRTGTLMAEQERREKANHQGMAEDEQEEDAEIKAFRDSGVREEAFLAIYSHFADDDVRTDTMKDLSFDDDNLLELQLFYLMEEVALHPGQDIAPSFYDALRKAKIQLEGGALASTIERDAQSIRKQLSDELNATKTQLTEHQEKLTNAEETIRQQHVQIEAQQKLALEQANTITRQSNEAEKTQTVLATIQQNHQAVLESHADETRTKNAQLREAKRSGLRNAVAGTVVGLGMGAVSLFGAQKAYEQWAKDDAPSAEKTRTWTPAAKKQAPDMRSLAQDSTKATKQSFQDTENARQLGKSNAETVTTMLP